MSQKVVGLEPLISDRWEDKLLKWNKRIAVAALIVSAIFVFIVLLCPERIARSNALRQIIKPGDEVTVRGYYSKPNRLMFWFMIQASRQQYVQASEQEAFPWWNIRSELTEGSWLQSQSVSALMLNRVDNRHIEVEIKINDREPRLYIYNSMRPIPLGRYRINKSLRWVPLEGQASAGTTFSLSVH